MLLTPAARWSIEKGAPSRAADDPSDKEPKWTAMFRWRRKKRLGALHAVHDHADDRRDDRAGYAATNQLADKRADIHAARRAGQHWDKRGQERSAGRAAQSASDCVARGSQVHILCRRADRIAADRAGNELDDEVDNRARHGVPSVAAANSRELRQFCPEINRLASFLLYFGHKSITASHLVKHDCAISQFGCSPAANYRQGARKIASSFDAHVKGYAAALIRGPLRD